MVKTCPYCGDPVIARPIRLKKAMKKSSSTIDLKYNLS